MLDPKNVTKTFPCASCKQDVKAKLVRNIANDGDDQVYWFCEIHGGPIFKGNVFIPHFKIKGIGINPGDLPIIEDYRVDHCAVCGAKGVDLHHFAPKGIFGKEAAEKWPKGYLCDEHHKEWHNKVTPNLTKWSD